MISNLNAFFQNSNIKFYEAEPRLRTINSTLYDFKVSSGSISLRNMTEDKDKVINIFLVGGIDGLYNFGGINGKATLPSMSGNYIALKYYSVTKVTAIHEMGHFLGLYHTNTDFPVIGGTENNGVISGNIDNSTCKIDGDGICDTWPDPFMFHNCNHGSSDIDLCFLTINDELDVNTSNAEWELLFSEWNQTGFLNHVGHTSPPQIDILPSEGIGGGRISTILMENIMAINFPLNRVAFTPCQYFKMNKILYTCRNTLGNIPNVTRKPPTLTASVNNSLNFISDGVTVDIGSFVYPCDNLVIESKVDGMYKTKTSDCVRWEVYKNGVLINNFWDDKMDLCSINGPGVYEVKARDEASYNSMIHSGWSTFTFEFTASNDDQCMNGDETCIDGGGSSSNPCNCEGYTINFNQRINVGRAANPTNTEVYITIPNGTVDEGTGIIFNLQVGDLTYPDRALTRVGSSELYHFQLNDIVAGHYNDKVLLDPAIALYDMSFNLGSMSGYQISKTDIVQFVGTSGDYVDMDADDQAVSGDYIDICTSYGLFQGGINSSGLVFLPNNYLTRGQAAKVLCLAGLKSGIIPNMDISGTQFPDVGECHEFFPFIQTLKNTTGADGEPVIRGLTDPNSGIQYYRSDCILTYQQFSKILIRALKLEVTDGDFCTVDNLREFKPSYDLPLQYQSNPNDLGQYMDRIGELVVFSDIKSDGVPGDMEDRRYETLFENVSFESNKKIENADYLRRKDMAIILAKAFELAAGINQPTCTPVPKPTNTISNRFGSCQDEIIDFQSSIGTTTIIGGKLKLTPETSGSAPSITYTSITIYDNQIKVWDGPSVDQSGNDLAYFWETNGGTLEQLTPSDFTSVKFTPPTVMQPTKFELYLWLGNSEGKVAQAFIDLIVLPQGCCPPSTNFSTNGVTQTSANLTWSNIGQGTSVQSYTIETSTDNSTWTTYASNITTTSLSLTGLAPITTYYVRVTSDCGGGNTSAVSEVFDFSTVDPTMTSPANIGACDPNGDDTTDPIFVNCPINTLIFGNDADVCGAYVNWADPVAVDNCVEVTVSHSGGPVSGSFLDVGNYMVMYTAVDTAGNSADCTFDVKVIDTQFPIVDCPQDVTVNTDLGVCEAVVNGIAPEFASDNCNFSVTWTAAGTTPTNGVDDASGTTFPVGTTTVTYNIQELSNPDGNQVATCEVSVTVLDTELPVIICPASDTIPTSMGGTDDCIAEYTWTHPTPTDNCGVTVYDISYTNPDGTVEAASSILGQEGQPITRNFDKGLTTILYHVADAASNTEECTFTILVEDDEIPTIFCDSVYTTNNYQFVGPADIVPNDTTCINIEVPTSASITDVNVLALVGSHPSMSELKVTLTSPAGTEVTLFDALCAASAEDFNFNLDDEHVAGINTIICGALTGVYQPQMPLSAFDGENSQGTWKVTLTSNFVGACGILDDFQIQIIGNDVTPAGNRLQVQADSDVCTYAMMGTDFDPPFYDNCPDSSIVHDYISGPFNHTLQGAVFPLGETTVTWTVFDEAGNSTSCAIIVEVLDTQKPFFVNCNQPDVVQEAEPSICGAYVNFSLPLAEDNCAATLPITQVDATGLTSGDVFPVGLTVLAWEAEDATGNTARCSKRIIVNDTQDPTMTCPSSRTVETDAWKCGATVNGISPTGISDNCTDNISVVYQIETPQGSGDILASGVANASGNFFPTGVSNVTYQLWDQPRLVISEVTHEIGVLNGGMDPLPYTVLTGDDYVEITNIGAASYDISELQIERTGSGNVEVFKVPVGTILPAGQTLVLHFGNGTDDPANFFYNLPCALDMTTAQGAGYVLSFKGRVLDAVAVNGFAVAGSATTAVVSAANWSGAALNTAAKGGITRQWSYDNNHSPDFAVADVCAPITIGSLNPTLEALPDNGSTMALQSIAANEVKCNFSVTVIDKEKPSCGEFIENRYSNASNTNIPNSITGGTVLQSVINVTDGYTVGEVVLENIAGTHPELSDLIFKITSPEGTQVVLLGGQCAGFPGFDFTMDDSLATVATAACADLNNGSGFAPINPLKAFYGESVTGDWMLEIADTTAANDGMLSGWTLFVNEIASYSQNDTTLPNDAGFCGAEFSWVQPRHVDNCCAGNIQVKYLAAPNMTTPPANANVKGGDPITEYFEVGETTVRYILTDAAGNIDSCEFKVNVQDVENPVVVCPADITVQLTGGQCREKVCYAPASATDNCVVSDTLYSIEPCSYFEIGTTPVTITILDSVGNDAECTFNVIINEFVPTNYAMDCNDLVHVSLDADCMYAIGADALLEGNNYHCYEDYIITLTNLQGVTIPTNPVISAAEIGQTINYSVLDPETGNSCWGQILVEDKQYPTIACPVDTVVRCNSSLLPAVLGTPALLSCENGVTNTYIDQVSNNTNCANPRATINRTWTVTDESGNSTVCTQSIQIVPIQLADIVFPGSYDGTSRPSFRCSDVAANPNLLSVANTGVPTVDGQAISGGGYCAFSISHTDEEFPYCAGSYDLLRTWKFYSPCQPVVHGVNPYYHVQILRVEDKIAPVVVCPADMIISTNPNNCERNYMLPALDITDACGTYDVEISTLWGTFYGNGGQQLPEAMGIGSYSFGYKVTDDCGNETFCDFKIKVEDQVAPIAICDQHTVVSIGGSGATEVEAITFDDGSYDNCNPVYYKVRRMVNNACDPNNRFDDIVRFCCEDLKDTIMVVLRVYDVPVPNGEIGLNTSLNRSNECMVEVVVQDKIRPVCQAPAHVTVDCEAFDPSLWAYGTGTGTDNCCIDTVTVSDNYAQFDTICNKGVITRTFKVTDCGDLMSTCTQRITVQYNQDYFVKFPNDVTVHECDGSGMYGEPTIYDKDCELIGISYTDERFDLVPDACYKIERTWKISNWCSYDPNLDCIYVPNPNNTDEGPRVSPFPPDPNNPLAASAQGYFDIWDADANCYIYKQIIKIIDNEDPVATMTGPDCDKTINNTNLWNDAAWWDATIASHNLCEGPSNLSLTATDSCSGNDVNVSYLLFLDTNNDGVMETVINSLNPPATATVQVNNADNPSFSGGQTQVFDTRSVPADQRYRFGLKTDTLGSVRTASVAWKEDRFFTDASHGVTPELPYGTHKIKWFVSDNCGNEWVDEMTFTIDDCKKPTVVCKNGISINLMNVNPAEVTIWASDILEYGEDNCTPADQLKVGICLNSPNAASTDACTGTLPLYPNGVPDTSITVNCATVGTVIAQVWAQDKAGNMDYCEAHISVQDNMGVCTGTAFAQVAGALEAEKASGLMDGLQGAAVDLEGSHPVLPPVSLFDISAVDGKYRFDNVPTLGQYTITPVKDDDHLNGVNTYDLLLIQKHLLGAEPIVNPYKLIAADVNKSGSITPTDIIELRKLILGIYPDGLPMNTSWRFVDRSYVFPNVNNPFAAQFAEVISIAQLQQAMTDGMFEAVKTGDIDASATMNTLSAVNDRTEGQFNFDVQNIELEVGEETTLEFSPTDEIGGYQFTLNLEGLEVLEILPSGKLNSNNFAVFPAKNAVTVSVHGTTDVFSIRVKALKPGKLSDMISLSSRITYAMAYAENGEKYQPQLRFNEEGGGSIINTLGFELYQNNPNPFAGKTLIGFYLPEAREAELMIHDAMGRVLISKTAHFAKGYQSIILDGKDLGSTGVLYYTLKAGTDRATRRMVRID